MTTDYIFRGDKVILPVGPDPALRPLMVKGWHRFHLGLDIGQHDPSALVCVADTCYPQWEDGRQRLGQRRRSVVFADRIMDTRYIDLARHVAALTRRDAIRERWTLTIDATGVGRAFSDVLDELGVEHWPVQMVGGMTANQVDRFWNVSKGLLITSLAGAFETQQLTIAADLPMRAELLTELESFQVKFTASGNQIFEGGGAGHHADAACALALSWWRSEQPTGEIGVGRLQNYW